MLFSLWIKTSEWFWVYVPRPVLVAISSPGLSVSMTLISGNELDRGGNMPEPEPSNDIASAFGTARPCQIGYPDSGLQYPECPLKRSGISGTCNSPGECGHFLCAGGKGHRRGLHLQTRRLVDRGYGRGELLLGMSGGNVEGGAGLTARWFCYVRFQHTESNAHVRPAPLVHCGVIHPPREEGGTLEHISVALCDQLEPLLDGDINTYLSFPRTESYKRNIMIVTAHGIEDLVNHFLLKR